MSKGSGRRRITPSDGLQYDPDEDMTNIEKRGASHYQSGKKEIRIGLRTGAPPTTETYYGSKGKRWASKGRKDDNRNWKSHHKGKQYSHNLEAKEKSKEHKVVPENVVNRLREKSINSDIKHGYPCKAWSTTSSGKLSLKSVVDMSEKFLVKFGGESYRGYATHRAKPYHWPPYSSASSSSYKYSYTKISYEVDYSLKGWALFEEMIRKVKYDNFIERN